MLDPQETPKSTTPKSSFKNDNNGEYATVEGVEAERLTELDNWHEVGGGEAQIIEPVVVEPVVVEPETA